MADATIKLGWDDREMQAGVARTEAKMRNLKSTVEPKASGGFGAGMLGALGAIGTASLGAAVAAKGIIDEFVKAKTAPGGSPLVPNGTQGVQRTEPASLDDAFKAAREFLRNNNG